MSRLAGFLVCGLAVLLLVGCSDSPLSSGAPSRSPSAPSTGARSTSAPTPTSAGRATPAAAVPPAPKEKACYRLAFEDLTKPTSSAAPVPCRRTHNARTIYVGMLDTVVDGHAVAVDSDLVQRQLATECPRRLAEYVGGSGSVRDLSRFRVVWYSPTLAESDAGADWFRCDLVAFADQKTLYPLPRRDSLRGVLDRDGALDTYGLCGTAAPGAKSFQRVICDHRHSWQAIDTIGIAGGRTYPGVGSVREAGNTACKDQARDRSDNSLKFEYGWEWPTRAQWRHGQHYGFCWSPG